MVGIDRALVAQGPLHERPFCHLVLDAYRRESSGTLVLVAAASGEVRIRLQHGRANKAWLATDTVDLLDALLPLCLLSQGSFRFYQDVDLLTGVTDAVCGQVDPFRLLAASLEAHVREDILDGVLTRYRKCPLRLSPRHDIAWLRLGPRDAVLVELIRAAPSTADELIAQTPLPAARIRRLLYAMLITKVLLPFDQTSRDVRSTRPLTGPALGPGAGRSSTPSPTFPSLRAPGASSVAPLDARRASVPTSTAPMASRRPSSVVTQPSIRSAPERQTGSSLRPRVGSSQHSISPRLQPPGASTTPPSSARPSSMATQRPSITLPVITNAASIPEEDVPARIERAERLVRTGRHDEALTEIDALLRFKPGRAELHGLYGLALFEKHSRGGSGLPRRVLQSLERALFLDPEETYALYTRGLICKRAGDMSRAVSHFKRVLQLEPEHLDCQRELRLATLRGVKGAHED